MTSTRLLTITVFTALAVLLPACKKAATETADSKAPAGISSDEQIVSYGIGYNMAKDVSGQGAFKVDQAAFRKGIEDGLAGSDMQIKPEVLQTAFQSVQQNMMKVAAAEGEQNLAAGNAFLKTNKDRTGVSVTDSGLQYEVLATGSGPKAQKTSTVTVHYHGTLIDGTRFDSSVDRGEPVEFPVTGVIPGWTEALQLMSVGDKWKLFVPANLAYGPAARPKIPGNSVLIFEVELLGIK